MSCPEATELARFALRDLDRHAMGRVRGHVDGCAACRAASSALVTVSRSSGDDDATDAGDFTPPQPGERVGRYIVLHELGAGAASVVCAAYDPDLDRTIALKLLRARGDDADERRLREARALARLSHPNLLTVHEVGHADGRLYLALELIDGLTVRQWIALEPRPWRAVRDVFIAAARGLAALHRAGLVHRDVKPDNLLVGADGSVKVVDLGLVGAGAGAGTPRYMAPEVRAGGVGDAASDQYALAAALLECLAGPSAIAATATATPATIESSAVPRALRRPLARALAAEPAARFPDLDALVTALADRSAPRRRLALAAALTLGGLCVAAGAWATAPAASGPSSCAQSAATLWRSSDAADVEARFAASGRAHAAESAARVVSRLGELATSWRDERVAVCEAHHERREISAARFDRAVSCLDGNRRGIALAVERLRDGDASVVDHAIDIVAALPGVEACRDDARLARAEPLPDDAGTRAAIAVSEDRLAAAFLARRAGDSDSALTGARTALEVGRGLGRRELVARSAALTADLLVERGDVAGALALADESIHAAAAARVDDIEAAAWFLMLYLRGATEHRGPAELEATVRAAEAAAERAGDPRSRARLANMLGLVAKVRGDDAGARDHYRTALEQLALLGDDRPEIAATLCNLSEVLANLGDLAEARATAEDALRRDRATFGPHHPSYAETLIAVASRRSEVGDLDGAAALFEESLTVFHDNLGDDDLRALPAHANLAACDAERGRLDEADEHARLALALTERYRGPDHPETAQVLLLIANIASMRGDLEAASDQATRALAIVSAAFGPDHPLAVTITCNLGLWALRRGDGTGAERLLRGALAASGAMPDSPLVATLHTGHGDALLMLGRRREALVELETALALRERLQGDPIELAGTRFALARALWDDGAHRRARELAQQAAAVFVAGGVPGEPYLSGLKTWSKREHVALELE